MPGGPSNPNTPSPDTDRRRRLLPTAGRGYHGWMRSLLPPDGDLEIVHSREYETRVYLVSENEFLVRGAFRDVAPPGLYVGIDPVPMTVHHMVVELRVAVPGLVITDVDVVFETHPNPTCPSITEHYGNLVGLSVARGFTHRVRELFGGPRGCTHTTALLQAMAPAVVQAMWALRMKSYRAPSGGSVGASADQREAAIAGNLNTCHVWAEDGEHVAFLRRGGAPRPPIPVLARLDELGLDPDGWRPGG